jgi:prevent-host-death family protein
LWFGLDLVDNVAIIWPYIAMKRVGVAELKNNLSRHLRAVEAGEEIEVTDHDRPVARLIPIEPKARLEVRPPLRPFSEIRDKVYRPANWPRSSLDLLLEDRRS